MTKINLLPWREERRQELQRQFIVVAVGVGIISALCVYLVYGYFNSQIDYQNARNKFITSETANLETRISEIQELQQRRDQIVESMKVIQELQGNRPVIVHAMGAIASTVPEGVYYTKIEKKGNVYRMYGVAETNNKISKLMRNLDSSEWFRGANLDVVGNESARRGDGEDDKKIVFELTVYQETPNQEEDSDGSGGV